jgi:hypothetical protein
VRCHGWRSRPATIACMQSRNGWRSAHYTPLRDGDAGRRPARPLRARASNALAYSIRWYGPAGCNGLSAGRAARHRGVLMQERLGTLFSSACPALGPSLSFQHIWEKQVRGLVGAGSDRCDGI